MTLLRSEVMRCAFYSAIYKIEELSLKGLLGNQVDAIPSPLWKWAYNEVIAVLSLAAQDWEKKESIERRGK